MGLIGQSFKWICSVAGVGSILIIFMIIFRKLTKKRIESRFLNILWILILIKLVVPIKMESNFNVDRLIVNRPILNHDIPVRLNKNVSQDKNEITNRENTIIREDEINREIVGKENINKKIETKVIFNKENIKYIWIFGVILMLFILVYTRIRLSLDIRKSKILKDKRLLNIFKNSKEKLNIKRKIDIYTGDKRESPFIIGLIRPKIYLPKDIMYKLTDEQISHIFLHELSHYKRGDLLFNILQILALSLHWFNPLVWISMRLIKNDRELACDDYVMEKLGEEKTKDYGYTLIELAKFNRFKKENLVSIHFADDNNQTKRRVEMVKKHERISMGKKIIIGVLALGIGIFILTQAKGKAFKEGIIIEPEEEKEIIVDTKYKEFTNLEEAKPYINAKLKIPEKLPANFKLKRVSVDNNETDVLSLLYLDESNGDDMILRMKDKEEESTIYNIPAIDGRSESNVINESKIQIAGKDIKRIDIEEMGSEVGTAGKDNYQVQYKNMIIRYQWEENSLDYWLETTTNFDKYKVAQEKKEEFINKEHIKILIDSLKPIDKINLEEANGRTEEDRIYDDLQVYSKKDMEKAISILGYDPKIQNYQDDDFKFTNISVQDSDGQGKNIYFNANKKSKDGKIIQLMVVIDGFMDTTKLDEMNRNGYYEYKQPNKKPVKIEAELIPILGSDVFKTEKFIEDISIKSNEYIWRHSSNNKIYKVEFMINSEEDLDFINKDNKEKNLDLYKNPTEEEQLEIVRELVK